VTAFLFVTANPGRVGRVRAAAVTRGWEIDVAGDRAGALARLERSRIDVVVVDVETCGAGERLLADVRLRHPDTIRLALLGAGGGGGVPTAAMAAHRILSADDDDAVVFGVLEQAARLADDLAGERVRAELRGLDTLIAPAPVLQRLLEVLESPRAGAGAIAAVLAGDVGLAAKILQVANSSFYAPRARAVSLDVAVARLGAQTIRSLALMDGFARRLDGCDPVLGRWLAAFNDHAGETARLAQRLAEPALRSDAFCAGLLHECGQLVFASCRPVVFSAHLRLQEGRPALCGEIEQETFGVTHSRAGAYLLSLWGFPLEIVSAAAAHDGRLDAIEPRSVIGAVLLAHQLVEAERVQSCGPPGAPLAPDPATDRPPLLTEVWAWRAEHAAAGPVERPPNLMVPA
jgi:HD-like signal output (HDOD) protein